MDSNTEYDVIVIGGSYAGLSAALTLARSIRKTLIIDSGKPCNAQAPESHNFITWDGSEPSEIRTKAREQIVKYPGIVFLDNTVTEVRGKDKVFTVTCSDASVFTTRKILFATGVKDIMPEIPGFAECWGRSVLHCPYCHGYEVRAQKTAVLGNGELAYQVCGLLTNWTDEIVLYTNGKSTLSKENAQKLKENDIPVIEDEISALEQQNGKMSGLLMKDGSIHKFPVMFAKIPFEQHFNSAADLGCEITPEGYIRVDDSQKTTVSGVFAAGDATTMKRTVSHAVAEGTKAAMAINVELIAEKF